jgi:DNA polymerase elongation subunit (family B)
LKLEQILKFYSSVTRHKNLILETGYKNGSRFKKVHKYKPYLFVPSNSETEYKTIDNKFVQRMDFASMFEANQFLKKYEDVEGFKIYGNDAFQYNFIYDNYGNKIEFDPSLIKVGYIDIEVDSSDGFPEADRADSVITAITFIRDSKINVWGCQEFTNSDPNVTYHYCKDEFDLIERFLTFWELEDIDIITGWYIRQFDIPYLVNRISKLTSVENAKRLSPWRLLTSRTINFGTRDVDVYILEGISTLDYIELYKYFVLEPRESYSLNYISHVELGEKKLDYSEYGNLTNLLKNNFQKYIEYNIEDTKLVQKIDRKRGLIQLAIAFAYDANINFPDIFGALKVWDTIITNHLMNSKTVVPQFKPLSNSSIVGAFVKEPIVGMHENVVSFDLTSLYPMLMRQYNMSPETKKSIIHSEKFTPDDFLTRIENSAVVKKWYDANCTVTANGVVFSKEKQGIIPYLIEERFNKRDSIKNEMKRLKKLQQQGDASEDLANKITSLDNAQKAIKVELNSVYGACCNKFFRWADNDIAQAVTIMGQMVIKYIAEEINKLLNQYAGTTNRQFICAIDTDSNYIVLGDLIKSENKIDEMDKFCEEIIQPVITQKFEELAEKTHVFQNTMNMKREAICDRAVWTGKKRYILNVHDNEGVRYKTPELKVVGSEAIRSTTPQVCRAIIRKSYELIIANDFTGLKSMIAEEFEKFSVLNVVDVASPSSVNGLAKYYDKLTLYAKGTPFHVKGALLYNKYLSEMNLEGKYKKIIEGDKIKFCYLKIPNPIREEVIAFPDILPPEFGLDKYVDYYTQWEKKCLSPIEAITTKIGWQLKKKAMLPI